MRVVAGLDGVIATDTVMSMVDGEGGRLLVRGHELRDLVAGGARLEDVAALLWDGFALEGGSAERARAGLAAGAGAAGSAGRPQHGRGAAGGAGSVAG